jgi:hypothetical protein
MVMCSCCFRFGQSCLLRGQSSPGLGKKQTVFLLWFVLLQFSIHACIVRLSGVCCFWNIFLSQHSSSWYLAGDLQLAWAGAWPSKHALAWGSWIIVSTWARVRCVGWIQLKGAGRGVVTRTALYWYSRAIV